MGYPLSTTVYESFAHTEIQTQGRVVLQMKVDFIFNVSYRLLQRKGGKGENSRQLFLGFFKGVGGTAPAPLSALIFYTICDTVSQKCCLAVLIISCVFKLNPPRLHSSVFSAPFIFLFPLIIEVSIPFSVV